MRFNSFSKTATLETQTVNHAGAKAYVLSPEMELYSAVVTTMLADSFYEKTDARLTRIQELVSQANPLFVAQLAVYAREQMYLRTAPIVLIGELAKIHNGDDLVSRTIARVVQRPDEITELLAYYQKTNARTEAKKLNRLSKQVQRGLALSFNRFDAYQFAKYDRATAVRLRDALFLVHPKAKDEAQQLVFDQITSRTLTTPYTWETELSALGQQAFETEAAKKVAAQAKWHELIDSGKMGYMATLRNLRNMLEADIDMAHLKTVTTLLANERAVSKAKQFPFRFLAAYREMNALATQYKRQFALINHALEEAIQVSTANLRGFDADTRVVVACDVSRSMQTPVSAKSKVLLYDIGLLLGMLLKTRSKNVVSGMFGDRWKIVELPGPRSVEKGVLANVDAFYQREGEVGYSTNGYLVLDDLIKRRYAADKVMFFTDVQLWDSTTNNRSNQNTVQAKWLQYKQLFPKAKLYLFDLAGHGKTPIHQESNDVFLIAGWSDKVFDVLQAIENGEDSLVGVQEIVI